MNAKQICIMNKLLIIYGIKETPSNNRKSNSNSNSNHINKHPNPSRNKSVIHNRILTVTMLVFIIILVVNACLAGTIPATPENITITFLTPTTVRVAWQTMIDLNVHPVEKYIVTYKPTDDRVMQDVAGNSEAIVLDRLSPGTQYSITVTAIWMGKKYRSRQIVFRTLDLPKPLSQQDLLANGMVFTPSTGVGFGGNPNNGRPPGISNGSETSGDDDAGITSTATNTLSHGTHRELPTIRGVEIGIVLIVLMVWAGAIALFFNRWGKIRMLLPYQPDYKHEQLKVPGTGVCSGGVCNGQHSHQNLHHDMFVKFDSSECGALAAYQPLHCSSSRHFHFFPEEHSASISERITRSRINSAIFVSSEGRGFDSIEFLRRHGSQSVLCRKAKSAENITDNGRKKSFSEKRQWQTDDNNDVGNDSDGQNEYSIELQECSKSVENHPIAALKNNVEKLLAATTVLGHSAAVTTSNRIVGSISIETPPPHIRDMERQQQKQQQQQQQRQQQQQQPQQHEQRDNVTTIAPSISLANTASINSTFHDSADTVEELVLTPIDNTTMNAKNSNYNNINPLTNNNNICRSPILIQQRSSTASPALTPQLQAQDNSPKAIKLKCLTPKISNLPMVSVSGPSPPDEKPPPPEYL
ncbi:uncharacterized protein LOC119636199 isoform X2 [Glossina fuscipes]|uniref:Uncharacterized protein LOC119636199 isoform X2 n=1 Tax=Glossina fuscipes TaxID=7396 RepID=A0A9C5YX57_9MUSC|nr:uncharacterized protein LOC119636199 isoform X2 [Glossina fuscipes]